MALGVKFVWRSLLAILLLGLAPPISSQAAAFGCAPTTVTPDSTLVMTLPWPHDGNLRIEGPKPEAIYYTVITYDNPKTVGFRPIVKGQDFQPMRRLTLRVADIKGDDRDPDIHIKLLRVFPVEIMKLGSRVDGEPPVFDSAGGVAYSRRLRRVLSNWIRLSGG